MDDYFFGGCSPHWVNHIKALCYYDLLFFPLFFALYLIMFIAPVYLESLTIVVQNNFANIMALKLLTLAKDRSLDNIQVFGDSEVIIKWINGIYKVENLFHFHL